MHILSMIDSWCNEEIKMSVTKTSSTTSTKQPLQGMKLEKEKKRQKAYWKVNQKEPIFNTLTLDCRQRIPEPSCSKKETVDVEILITSGHGNR